MVEQTRIEVLKELMAKYDEAKAHQEKVLGGRFSLEEFHQWFTSQVTQVPCKDCDGKGRTIHTFCDYEDECIYCNGTGRVDLE